MSLYYFHVDDGTPHDVPAVVNLPDLEAARRQAGIYFTALIRDGSAALGVGEVWQLRVTDEQGILFFSLQFASIRRAAAGPDAGARAERAFPAPKPVHDVTHRKLR